MKKGTYIYAKHPEFGDMYPAVVDKCGRKWLYYTDDNGRNVRIDKAHCMTQNKWAVEQGIARAAYIDSFGRLILEKGEQTVIGTDGFLYDDVGHCWVKSREATQQDFENYPVIV